MNREIVHTRSSLKSAQVSIRAKSPAAEGKSVHLSPALLCAGSAMAINVAYAAIMVLLAE